MAQEKTFHGLTEVQKEAKMLQLLCEIRDALLGGGEGEAVTAEFTRPSNTTAYATGDAVNNSTSAPVPMQFAAPESGVITGFRIETDAAGLTPSMSLVLFSSSPTMFNDNVANAATYATSEDLIAVLTGTLGATGSTAKSFVEVHGLNVPYSGATDGIIYGYLTTNAAFTPASGEKFRVTLFINS